MGDLKFSTIKEITKDKRVDLLINFAYGMDYKRGSKRTIEKYTDFFGTDEWIKIAEKYKDTELNFCARDLIDLYMDQLKGIGYCSPKPNSKQKNYFNIYNSKNTLIYYLIFASKNERGYDFCVKMRPYVKQQQELI